jgi:hypothetical protein
MAIEKEWRTAKERYEKCDNYGEENKKKIKQKKRKFKQMCTWLEEKKKWENHINNGKRNNITSEDHNYR